MGVESKVYVVREHEMDNLHTGIIMAMIDLDKMNCDSPATFDFYNAFDTEALFTLRVIAPDEDGNDVIRDVREDACGRTLCYAGNANLLYRRLKAVREINDRAEYTALLGIIKAYKHDPDVRFVLYQD